MEMKTKAFRLPVDLIEKMDKIAREIDRNESFIVRAALKAFVDDYVDYHIALERLHDSKDDIISSAEMESHI